MREPGGRKDASKRRIREWVRRGEAQAGKPLELSPVVRIVLPVHADEVRKKATEYVRLRDKYIERPLPERRSPDAGLVTIPQVGRREEQWPLFRAALDDASGVVTHASLP